MRYSDNLQQSSRPGKAFLVFIFLTILLAAAAFGQSKDEKRMRARAVKHLNAGNFKSAIDLYTDLLKIDPQNADYNYEMGLAVYEDRSKRGEAAKFFERAILNFGTDTIPDVFLFAGKAEQFKGNFDLAIGYYNTYRSALAREEMTPEEMGIDIDRYIEMCENGKVQFENNKEHVRIENAGPIINSEFDEYSAAVKEDESIILFTSRRPNSTGGQIASDGKYYEDIYYSVFENGQWTRPKNYDSTNLLMSSQINTETHDAVISYNDNERQIFIYRDNDVWYSNLENDKWTVPALAEGRINTEKSFEPSVFITEDQQTMFVVSDIGSGFGGRDIYLTTKDENGVWNQLENMGRNINTKYDDDAPFVTKDGNTLYFASKGHNSMGGYDIFKSVLDENNEWTMASNLGSPINSPGDDIYFFTIMDGVIGYYASDRDGGYGEKDIYRLILDCKAVSATRIRGQVFSEDQKKPAAATIEIYRDDNGELVNIYKADPISGKYNMRLKTETTYKFRIDAEGYLPHEGEFTVPKQCDYYTLYQEIKIDNLEDSTGRVYAQRAFVNNAFFDVDQKIKEDFEVDAPETMDEEERDSLSSILAEKYNPIELTNYVQLIDIIDPRGIRLGSETLGNRPVEEMQTREEIVRVYSEAILRGDENFFAEVYPEARVDYSIASEVKPDEEYPKKQIGKIDEILEDQPIEALYATKNQPTIDQMSQIEKRQRYDLLVAEADKMMINRNYNGAEQRYKEAVLLMPSREYAQNQLASIEQKRLAEAEKESTYVAATNAGDSYFIEGNYSDAQQQYKAATEARPNDAYALSQLKMIEARIAAEREEVLMRQQAYQRAIDEADAYFNSRQFAMARAAYVGALDLLPEQDYPIQQIAAIEEIVKAEKDAITEQNKAYAQLISNADKASKKGDLGDAKELYEKALMEEPGDQYAMVQIDMLDAKLEAMRGRLSQQAAYDELIAEADADFQAQQYMPARMGYEGALELMPENDYPIKQLAAIEEILKSQKLTAIRTNTGYVESVTTADKLMVIGNYKGAMQQYVQAMEYLPSDTYSRDRIALLEQIIKTQGAKGTPDLQAQYDAEIAKADKSFDADDLDPAERSYRVALSLMPDQQYPKDQLALISQRRAGSQVDESYVANIANGDQNFVEGKYSASKQAYEEALIAKPNDMYAIGQIKMIDARLDAQRQEFALRQTLYNKAIAEADNLYNTEQWALARDKYDGALELMSEQDYPIKQIAAIEEALSAERKAVEASNPTYANLVSQADEAAAAGDIAQAKSLYEQAFEEVPGDQYALSRMNMLNAKLEAMKNLSPTQKAYDAMVAEADEQFNAKQYVPAKISYEGALELIPESDHPMRQIAAIDKLLKDDMLENIHTNPAYVETITNADRLAALGELNEALEMYLKAVTIMPSDEYAVEKVAFLNAALGNDRKIATPADRAAYDKRIAEADRHMDANELDQAAAKYRAALALMPEEDYPMKQLSAISELRKAKYAGASEYATLIDQADKLFASTDIGEALKTYKSALSSKPGDAYATGQIKMVQARIEAERKNLLRRQDQYNEMIALADEDFTSGNYFVAREEYQGAIDLLPEHDYPIRQIAAIEEIINASKSATAANNADYSKSLDKAEKLAEKGDLSKAIEAFEKALDSEPNDVYALDRIASLEAKVESTRNAISKKAQYDSFVEAGDRQFNQASYLSARNSYQGALDLLPEEDYPLQQIRAIEEILKANKILTVHNSPEYVESITMADKLYVAGELEAALEKYEASLALYKDDAYAADQIEAVKLALEQERAMLAQRKAEYDKHIEMGDASYSNSAYYVAGKEYQSALELMPEEDYPMRQLSVIEALLSKEKAASSAISEDYLAAVTKADKLALDNELEGALQAYQTALNERPGDLYAMNQISAIQDQRAAQNDLMKERKADYDKKIATADAQYQSKAYYASAFTYTNALELMPEEDYPMQQIEAIENMLNASKSNATSSSNAYKEAVNKADAAHTAGNLRLALDYFEDANALMPSDQYALYQMQLIEAKIEAERTDQLRRQVQYDNMIAKADYQFEKREFYDSKGEYLGALELIPEQDYPIQQIAAIEEILKSEKQVSSSANATYLAAVKKGDQYLAQGELRNALTQYESAKAIQVNDAYAQFQIDLVNDKLEAERRAQKQRQAKYDALIASADTDFEAESYVAAKTKYSGALDLIPEQDYPINQIAAIEEILKAESAVASKGNDAYKQAITKADAAFATNNLDQALTSYKTALSAAPGDAYAASQLALVESSMKSNSYDALVAKADKEYSSEQLQQALTDYKAALAAKPADTYATGQIALIESKLGSKAQYAALIKEADAAYAASNTESALAKYQAALIAKPADSYATDQISKINQKQRGGTQYAQLIKEADALYAKDELKQAQTKYEQALNTKPGESYPVEQLAAIAARLGTSKGGTTTGEKIVFRNILFDFDKSDLRQASINELKKINTYMSSNGEVLLQIDGHADWIGTHEYNMALSERRAKAAYNYLADKGINSTRLSYQFFGETVPIAPNANPDGSDNPDGRQLNRRCEFKIDTESTSENITLKF